MQKESERGWKRVRGVKDAIRGFKKKRLQEGETC